MTSSIHSELRAIQNELRSPLSSQQTIRELFDVNEGEKKEVTPESSVPQPEEEETGNKQNTTILEQVSHTQNTGNNSM